MEIGKIPPNAIEAEQAVLGSMLTDKDAVIAAIEVLKYMPLDRILIETDAPYLTPVPFRGKRNNSMYLVHVINKIAEIKELDSEEVANITLNNAKTLFKI